MNMRDWENSWKVYRDFLPSLTVWYSLPENSRNKIRAEITHACAEVMRTEGDDPMSAPAVKDAQTEMIGKIGSLLGFPVARAEGETAARHEDIIRLITRMNQRYPCPRQEEDPKFAKLKEEVKNALANTAEGSPEREALLSAYQRMLHLPTHPEDASPEKSRKGRDDFDEILRIFK